MGRGNKVFLNRKTIPIFKFFDTEVDNFYHSKFMAKLANLAYHLSRKNIQANKDGHHDPVEDTFATLQVFLPHEDLLKGGQSTHNPNYDIAMLTLTGT